MSSDENTEGGEYIATKSGGGPGDAGDKGPLYATSLADQSPYDAQALLDANREDDAGKQSDHPVVAFVKQNLIVLLVVVVLLLLGGGYLAYSSRSRFLSDKDGFLAEEDPSRFLADRDRLTVSVSEDDRFLGTMGNDGSGQARNPADVRAVYESKSMQDLRPNFNTDGGYNAEEDVRSERLTTAEYGIAAGRTPNLDRASKRRDGMTAGDAWGKVRNAANDAANAVGKVFKGERFAGQPNASGFNRKGGNSVDSGSNRFGGAQSNVNQVGSLWNKPNERGSFLERLSGRERLTEGEVNMFKTSKWSEHNLDPNRMYVESNQVGQPFYDWGYSSGRGRRGKPEGLLEAVAQGL